MQTTQESSGCAKSHPSQRRSRKNKGMCGPDRPLLEANAAGVDVGAREMFVAVPPDRDPQPVRSFGTFTADLEELVSWLKQCGITTVAMESTGVYWIPLYQMLEKSGIKPCLVNARNMKNVPGRRTDWQDCQWLQYLHAVGLLRAAFRPDEQVCAARTILRYRGELVQMASQHVLHMHKALTQMNVQIHHVISDITGLTGLAIVDAIVAGERNPAKLAHLRDRRIQADEHTIRKSLRGNWKTEHLFTLQQSRKLYRECLEHIAQCDQEIENLLPDIEPPEKPRDPSLSADGPPSKKANRRAGDFHFDVRGEVHKLFGVDVMRIPGIGTQALPLLSEIGTDMSRFPTAGHFASWLGLCPDNDISGGKVLWRGVRKIQNRAGQMFRMAAYSLHRSRTRLGDFLRRMKYRLGPKAATTATAHKIAVIFYTLVNNQVEYDDSLWAAQDAAHQQRAENKLKQLAQRLGYEVIKGRLATTA
jgi:transposase